MLLKELAVIGIIIINIVLLSLMLPRIKRHSEWKHQRLVIVLFMTVYGAEFGASVGRPAVSDIGIGIVAIVSGSTALFSGLIAWAGESLKAVQEKRRNQLERAERHESSF